MVRRINLSSEGSKILGSKYFNKYAVHILLFYKTNNKCTIISQIITLLLNVSTLLCHSKGDRSQYLAKLHK